MKTIRLTNRRNREIDQLLLMEGESEQVSINLGSWEEDNDSVTSVSWVVDSGSASISNESLESSVASAVITGSSDGRSLIKVTFTTSGNSVLVHYIKVYVRDPEVVVDCDLDYV